MKTTFQSITGHFIGNFSVKFKAQFLKFKYKPKVNALKNRYASHFFTLFVCKETFNKILTNIFHTFNFHLQQIIYTTFLLFFRM
ncbi:hypothetical protein EFY85_06920 [Salmonella enterica]|nr:hypothetical protein [Salmonella enterica]